MAITFNPIIINSDLHNHEYFLQDDVCRLCWQRNCVREIASNTAVLNGTKIEVLAVIRECLDLDLCDVNYPNKVCEQCWDILRKFYAFRLFCKEADSKLREILESSCRTTETIAIPEIKTESSDVIPKDAPSLKIKTQKTNDKNGKPKKSLNYCYICCSDFNESKTFITHNMVCHGIENGMYKCFGCEKKFKSIRTRTSHETNFCKALKEGYKCVLCSRLLPLRKLYEAHMRYHAGKENDVLDLSENIFKCRKCDTSFKNKDNLKEHMASHKSVDNHFVCETCGRVFLRQDYLQKHLMIHQGVKRHVCTYCGLRFVQKSSLNVHLRKHTGERPYQCDVCPQRCVSSSNLLAHRRRHLGIKQFECAICGKQFGYKLSLVEHIGSAHAPAQAHQCTVCGALFSRKKGLQRHTARLHAAPKTTGTKAEIYKAYLDFA